MMAPIRCKLPCALVAIVALTSTAPTAAASDDASAAAESLFREGRRLMDAGDFAAACPKLAESLRLDPGNGTLARLATCHEKQGRIATAWSEFAELVTSAQRAGQTDREKFARQHAAVLQPRLSQLTLRVTPEVAAIAGLRVRRDEIDVGSAAWGVAVPLDPGEHRVEATAPGRKPWSATVTIGLAADQREVNVPALGFVDPPPSNAIALSVSPASAPAADREPTRRSGGTQRALGIAIGAVGVAALGGGAYFGVRAMSDASGAKQACPSMFCTNAAGIQQNDDAKSNARMADFVLPLGLAAAVTGSLLYFLAPDGARIRPVVGAVNGVHFETQW